MLGHRQAGGRLMIYDFRFAGLRPLRAALSRTGEVRRAAQHPFSLYSRLVTG